MTLEDTIGALLDAKLAPVRSELIRLTREIEALRRALPPMLVSVAEASRVLGISLSTAKRRVKDGTLPVQRFGRSVRVNLTDLRPAAEAEVVRLAIGGQT